MNTHQTPFIAIEGPIGVGKTSLSLLVSEALGFSLLKEIVYENPFLESFYENIDTWGFQTEMFFLVNRYLQLEDIQKNYIEKAKPVVADYHIFKNLLFADMNLHPDKFSKFQKIYHTLIDGLLQPNLLIVINASLDTLKHRINIRSRDFEELIEDKYLEKLIIEYDAYATLFELEHPDIPVLRINGDLVDFVNNPDDLKTIIEQIKELI